MLRHAGHESMESRLPEQRGMFSYVGERDRMATIQAETIVTITVDRGMRDALRTCLRSEAVQLENYEGVISGADAEAAHAALARAAHLSRCSIRWGGRTTIRASATRSP